MGKAPRRKGGRSRPAVPDQVRDDEAQPNLKPLAGCGKGAALVTVDLRSKEGDWSVARFRVKF
ncbi:hypothetical protein, partial [Sphingomonas sp. LH128]|uniref:hypothetical protein n=1 Tax=Sphingomonas sp. LH128 TaxID=473781 RepID=UPI002E14C903